MSSMKVDMDTVAGRAGVSRTTVHRALASKLDISEETRRRVLEVARELGYRRRGVVRGSGKQRAHTIAVVIPGLWGEFWSTLVQEIETTAQSLNHHFMLSCSQGDPAAERRLVDSLLEQAIDGLILAPVDHELNADYYSRLAEAGVRMVFVDRFMPGVNVDAVATDNLLGGYLAGCHLREMGRRSIAFLPTSEVRDRRSTSVQSRLNGLNRALGEGELPPASVLGLELPDMSSHERYAHSAVSRWLDEDRPLDGLFAAHDGLAAAAIHTLLDRGVRVPQDVSVIGFNDEPSGTQSPLGLTTLHQPLEQIGAEAVRLLLRRVEDTDTRLPRQRIMLEPSLVVRQSCGGLEP